MSTKPTISRVSVLDQGRDLSAPIIRPQKAATKIDCLELENPDASMLSELRSDGWEIKFQTFNVIWTPNGTKGHHFIYMERSPKVSTGEYHQ